MRISILEGDPGYNTWQDFSKARIKLDGKEVFDVVTADEMLGFVLVLAKDDYGHYMRNPATGRPMGQKLRGRVEITFIWN